MNSFLRWLRRRVGLGTLVAVAGPLFVAFVWLRFWGLPEGVKDRLLAEIERRHILPFPVAIDRLLLDPTGAILAKRVTVFRDAGRQGVLLQIDQVRLGIAWLDCWRGRGFIDRAGIANAEVQLPLGKQTVDFHEVNADVYINGPDIQIQNAQIRFLDLVLSIRGTVHNEGFPKPKPSTPEQAAAREAIWFAIVRAVDDIGTESPLTADLEFETSTRHLDEGRANFRLLGRHLTWRNAPVDEVSIHGSLADGVVTLDDLRVALERGDLTAYGEWNLASRAAELQFTSSLDFTSLAPAFPGALGQALARLEFPNEAPSMTGRVLFDFQDGLKTDVQADLDWRDFRFNRVAFERLTIPLAYDGHRLLIPEMEIAGDAGSVDLKLFFDGTKPTPDLNAHLLSSLEPGVLQGVFGPGFDNFLKSCSFSQGGPKIEATATGSALKTDAWNVKGKIAAAGFSYKQAGFDTATSDFTFADSKLELPDLEVHRAEGTGTGGILYDFKNRAVELRNLVTQLNVPDIAPMMGPKFVEYTKPYRFEKPPLIRTNGKVDLQDSHQTLDTDLTVEIGGRSPMEWTLLKIPFIFNEPQGTLAFKDRSLTVTMRQCGFYDGGLTGTIALDLAKNPSAFDLDLNLAKVDFRKFMTRAFDYDKSTGVLTAQTRLTGLIGRMETLAGSGEVRVDSGAIAQIPFLGSLTPEIPGLSAADSAHGHFTVGKGTIHTDDLDISSETFALIGRGDYDFARDRTELDMRVNAKTIFGVLLYPVSKIFEYHGSGPMKNVTWVPKNF